MRMPSPPSGLSSNRPVPAPIIFSNEAADSPGGSAARTGALKRRETSLKDIALGQPNYPARVKQIGDCFSNQFEIPVLFYILIALALPLRHADLFIVLMSWVFVVLRFLHAGVFVTTN